MLTDVLRRSLFISLILILLFEIITGGGCVYIRQREYSCSHIDIHNGLITLSPDFYTTQSINYIPFILYTDISKQEAGLFLHFNIDKERIKEDIIHVTINSVQLGNRIIDVFSEYEFTISASNEYIRPVTNTPLNMSNKPCSLKIDGKYRLLSNNDTHNFHVELLIDVTDERIFTVCWERWLAILNH